eukprot:gene14562-10409_t
MEQMVLGPVETPLDDLPEDTIVSETELPAPEPYLDSVIMNAPMSPRSQRPVMRSTSSSSNNGTATEVPPPVPPELLPPALKPVGMIQTGTFTLTRGDCPESIQQTYPFTVAFETAFDSNPQVGMFMVQLEADQKTNTRIACEIGAVERTHFTFHLGSWGDSKVYLLKYAWIASTNPGVSITSVTIGSFPDDSIRDAREITLPFGRAISSMAPPKVVVGVKYLDCDHKENRRLRTSIGRVTPTNFTLFIKVWSKSVIWKVGYTIITIFDPNVATTLWDASIPEQQAVSSEFLRDISVPRYETKSMPLAAMELPLFSWTQFQRGPSVPVPRLSRSLPLVIPMLQGFDVDKKYHCCLRVIASLSLHDETEEKMFELFRTHRTYQLRHAAQFNELDMISQHFHNLLNLTVRSEKDCLLYGLQSNFIIFNRHMIVGDTQKKTVYLQELLPAPST